MLPNAIEILILLLIIVFLIKDSLKTKTHLDINKSNLYSTKIIINNKPFNFIVDTGSSHCVINQAVAESLTYERIENTSTTSTVNGNIDVQLGKFLIVYNGYKIIITMQIIPNLPEDGLLGMDFFKAFDCMINCQKNIMYGNYNKFKS